jgi:hypothetical protein
MGIVSDSDTRPDHDCSCECTKDRNHDERGGLTLWLPARLEMVMTGDSALELLFPADAILVPLCLVRAPLVRLI